MASQLEIQEKFNEVLIQTNKLLLAQSKIVATQAEMLANMVLSIQSMDFTKLQKQAASLKDVTSNFEKGLNDVKKTSKETWNDLSNDIEKVSKKGNSFKEILDQIEKKEFSIANVGKEAFAGLGQGLKLTTNLTRNLLVFAKHLTKSFINFGISIVTFPFKVLRGLIEMSSHGGDNALAQQLEEIRKEFGYLAKESGQAIISMSRSMRGELANTGLSVYRVFGNLVDKLKYFADYAKALGPIFDTMMNHIGEGGAEALGAYNKALGFTNEGLRAIASRAMSSGREINSINQEIANYALQMSDSFGVSMKLVSRDVGEMMNDFQHFGQLGAKELTQVSVYAHKLGIEVKSLGAIMDKWMNFEDAAQGAAQLSQAFGLNIDALEMMKAQDPAQKIEQMRKAFFRAGKSVETMTYQERRLLAQQTGLDDASIGLAFSLKNQGMSYDQIQKKGNAAQKAQLTQAQAMEKLSGAIERMIKSGSGINEGFVDTFFRGFRIGIVRTRDFRKILREIQRDLRSTLRAGREVGRMFVQMFPGVQDFFGGMKDFFEPRKFTQMLGKVKEAFHTFFEQIAGKNPRALPNLLENLKTGFLSWFDGRSANGQRFLNGAKQMFSAFVEIVNGLLAQAITGLTQGIDFIADLLSGRKNLNSLLQMVGGQGGFIGKLFGKLFLGIPELVDDLGNSILRLWKTFKDKYGDRIINFAKAYFATTLAVSLGTAFARGFLAAAAGVLASGIGALAKRFAGRASETMSGAGRVAGTNVPHLPHGSGSAAADTINQTSEAAQAMQRSGGGINRGLIAKLLVVAAVVTIGMIGLLVATSKVVMWVRENNVTQEEIIKAGLIVGIASASMVASAAAVALLQAGMAALKYTGAGMAELGTGLLALAGVVSIMLGAALVVVAAVKHAKFTPQDITKGVILMGAASSMMIAASAIAVVAAGLGAIVTLTEGAGLLAIGIGLAVLATVIGGIVVGVMDIMEKIKTFNPGQGFETKANVFIGVLRAVTSFAASFGTISAALSGGIVGTISDALTGRNSMESSLQSLGRLVDVVVMNIERIINKVTESARNITPEQLTNGTRLVEILRNVGEFARDLQPSTELITDSSAWFEGNNSVAKINAASDFISRLISGLRTFMSDVFMHIQDITRISANNTFDENALNGIRSFAQIMKSVGQVARSLMPDPATLQIINHSHDFSGALENMQMFVGNVLRTITGSNLFTSIGDLVQRMIDGTRNISPNQLNAMQIIGPVYEGIFHLISSLAELFRVPQQTTVTGAVTTILGGQSVMAIAVADFLDKIKTKIPEIISSLSSSPFTRQQGQMISLKVRALRDILNGVGTIPTLVRSFGNNATDVAVQNNNAVNTIYAFSDIMRNLFDVTTTSGRGLQAGLTALAGYTIPQGLETNARRIGTVFTALHAATDNATNISEMATRAQAMMQTINSGAISRIGNSISKMVEEVNSISTTMNNMDVPNINIALRRISHDIGLGESGTFTVHKGNTHVNVNLTVTMDSRDLQTTLVETSRNTQQGPKLNIVNAS